MQLAAAALVHDAPPRSQDLAPLLRKRLASCLCFDEMQVGDPFAALALKGARMPVLHDACADYPSLGTLEWLFSSGGVLVSTSNRPPWELNCHGVQEDMFDHFVDQLQQHCEVVELSTERDYRRVAVPGQPQEPCYLTPDDDGNAATLQRRWLQLAEASGLREARDVPLSVAFNRTLSVPRALGTTAAWFDFAELCDRPLGSADYAALAASFQWLFVRGVPQLSLATRDQARRFIVLVDELYNARRRLVCTAAAEPDALFAGEGEAIIDLEGLQFETAVEGVYELLVVQEKTTYTQVGGCGVICWLMAAWHRSQRRRSWEVLRSVSCLRGRCRGCTRCRGHAMAWMCCKTCNITVSMLAAQSSCCPLLCAPHDTARASARRHPWPARRTCCFPTLRGVARPRTCPLGSGSRQPRPA